MAVTFRNLQVDRLLREVPAQVLERYGAVLAPALQEAIQAEVYNWPRETTRYGGGYTRTVFRPRDIVDTKRLLQSQTAPEVTLGERGARMEIQWTAPYSGAVLRGEGNKPGRNWIKVATTNVPLPLYFEREYRALAGT